MKHDVPTFRQLCAVIKDVVTTHPNERGANLIEAIKVRLAQLTFTYDPDQLTRAFKAVERSLKVDLVTPIEQPHPKLAPEPINADPPWRGYDRGRHGWVSAREVLESLTNQRRSPHSAASSTSYASEPRRR